MVGEPHLVACFEDRNGIKHEPNCHPHQRTSKEIALGSQLGEGRGGIRGGRCAQRSEGWGRGQERTELVEAREIERNAGNIAQQRRSRTAPQTQNSCRLDDIPDCPEDECGLWREWGVPELVEMVRLLNACLEEVNWVETASLSQ